MKITHVDVTIVEVPQIPPIAPYRSHIRTSSTTQSAIVKLETDEGVVGWGEHNVNFLPNLSGRAQTAVAQEWLIGREATNITLFHQTCPLETRLKSGIEMAMWDIVGQVAGLPLAELWGGIIRPEVELAACMGIQPYSRAGEIASWCVEQGFRSLKTKAGASIESDLEMVRGIRDAVGDKLKLRIDPNRAYTREQGAELAKALEDYDLQYLEQPIMAEPLTDAVWLRSQSRTPLALNESVTNPASVWDILHVGAAEFILPDTHIAGGLWPCLVIGHLCAAAGATTIMHCGHDLGPKTASMVHIAACSPAYTLGNDSTYYGLKEDIITEPLSIIRGTIAVPKRPGLGVAVDPVKLSQYAVDC
ncbi:MAG: mandelate racemase/muconate lactonizing enzyme family protein [Planctomycetota bacterium]|nr:mandelate racemase/muconate lactonizing enzyme family protein [Planctomycetota bacterium]MDA1211013.1 mandelate racemase/muconate lactonizing enzyme family protein [Planctomycetota bacterium]